MTEKFTLARKWIAKYPKESLLVAIFLSLPFDLYPRLELAGYSVRISQVLALVLIAFCVPILINQCRELVRMPWIFLSLFVAVSLLSSAFAFHLARALVVTVIYMFIFLLSYSVSKVFRLRDSAILAKAIFGVSLLVVTFCLWQFWADSYGVSVDYTLLLAPYTKAIFGFARVQGFSLEPLYLANYLLLPLGLSMGYYFYTNSKKYLGLIGIFSGVIFLTIARGALLAVIAMVVVWVLIALKQKKLHTLPWLALTLVVSALAALGMIRAGGEVAKSDIETTIVTEDSRPGLPNQTVSGEGNTERAIYQVTGASSDKSVGDRLSTTKDALRLGSENAVFGVGPGNFGASVNSSNPARYPDTRQIVNNEPAEIFAETGIFGLLLAAFFAGWVTIKMIGYKFVYHEKTENIWFVATTLMLVGFAVQWQTFSTLYITHIWVMVGIFMALVNSGKKKTSRT